MAAERVERGMTDEQAMDLGRRATACKAWRWMPGMLTVDGRRVVGCITADLVRYVHDGDNEDGDGYDSLHDTVPDLRDAATLGTLLALVREAWRDPGVYTVRQSKNDAGEIIWEAMLRNVRDYVYESDTTIGGEESNCGEYSTEAEALVDALEGAP